MICENETFDQERAFYGAHDLTLKNCRFDGTGRRRKRTERMPAHSGGRLLLAIFAIRSGTTQICPSEMQN